MNNKRVEFYLLGLVLAGQFLFLAVAKWLGIIQHLQGKEITISLLLPFGYQQWLHQALAVTPYGSLSEQRKLRLWLVSSIMIPLINTGFITWIAGMRG